MRPRNTLLARFTCKSVQIGWGSSKEMIYAAEKRSRGKPAWPFEICIKRRLMETVEKNQDGCSHKSHFAFPGRSQRGGRGRRGHARGALSRRGEQRGDGPSRDTSRGHGGRQVNGQRSFPSARPAEPMGQATEKEAHMARQGRPDPRWAREKSFARVHTDTHACTRTHMHTDTWMHTNTHVHGHVDAHGHTCT